MLDVFGLREYTTDWQHLVCLLYALNELGAGGHRRRDVCEFIHRRNYLELVPEDVAPYRTQTEPSWQTDIAYARKIGVIMGIIGFNEHDSWTLERDGREELQKMCVAGLQGSMDVKKCFLWSREFRRFFDSEDEPSSLDSPRPPRRAYRGADYRSAEIAREWTAGGKALGNSELLSAVLGFRVSSDVRSLALAIQLAKERMQQVALEDQ